MRHETRKIKGGVYKYRGYACRRDYGLPTTYYGAWSTGSYQFGFAAGSLRELKEDIDSYLDAKPFDIEGN